MMSVGNDSKCELFMGGTPLNLGQTRFYRILLSYWRKNCLIAFGKFQKENFEIFFLL